MARALLDLKRADLAKLAGVSEKTIGDYERGQRTMLRTHVEAVRRTLERLGVEFMADRDGVMRR